MKSGILKLVDQGNDVIGKLLAQDEKQQLNNHVVRNLTNIQQDSPVDKCHTRELKWGCNELVSKIYDAVLVNNGGLGTKGGREDYMEWYGNCGDVVPDKKKRKRAL